MNVGLFFLVALPCRAAFVAPCALLAEPRHMALYAAVLERSHVLPMACIGVGPPSSEGRKVSYFFQGFTEAAKRFGKRPKVNPFQMWLL
jgi:hypothetical protein